MAYKVSYKVVSEQGEQLKNLAKDMDNYISQTNQIVSKLGNDELLVSVREDLKKFSKQLEEEKTILNLAGQVITDIIQSYTGVEKKSVSKVDKAKAHNRDFYKRPVAVASAGAGAATATASAGAASASAYSSTTTSTTVNYTKNITAAGPSLSSGSVAATTSAAAPAAAGSILGAVSQAAKNGGGVAAGLAAAGVAAVTGAGLAGAAVLDHKQQKKEEEEA
ncbi:MAG: hypothetical protein K5888_00260 [Lachnospiraceae bacterium]|nr:hypothetical protein [Lachnospiraceae bacterium]